MAKQTLKTYIVNTADKVFSKYIRVKEADAYGMCVCVTCGKRAKWNDGMDAGHYADRGRWATRFNDKNVHPQCVSCNRFKNKMPEYAQYMIKRYGKALVDDIVFLSHKPHGYDLDDLKEMVKEWREEINKMSVAKNL
jgi:hypothetical protein